MISVEDKAKILNMYLVEGKGYKQIATEMGMTRDRVRNCIVRYKANNDLEKENCKGKVVNPVLIQDIVPRNEMIEFKYEKRIKDLEMQVELLQNFPLLKGRR